MQKTAKLELIEMREEAELPELVARLLNEGCRPQKIADRLGITRKSLDAYLRFYGRRIERRADLVETGG